MLFLLIAIAVVLFYLAFSVNTFGFGLLMYDNASEEAFSDISERKRTKLNKYFNNKTHFKYFVQIFNNFALLVIAYITYRFTIHTIPDNTPLQTGLTIVAISILWLIYMAVVQYFSKRLSSKWIVNALTKLTFLITILYTLFIPLIMSLAMILNLYRGRQFSEEEKEDLVERAIESFANSAGIDEPLMEEEEKEMIENIFDLDQTTVKAVMVPRIEMMAFNVDSTLQEITKIVEESGHSRFPVYGEDADDVLGFLYVKDLFCHSIEPNKEFEIRQFIRKPFVIPETKMLDELLQELKKSRIHIALVVDEYGGTSGLVTMEDIIEVIVGDIQDEHDFERTEIVKLDDGSVRVDANVSMEDLADFLDIEFEDERFETVGGLIYDLAGTLPEVGQVLEQSPLKFTVEKVSGQRIETIRIHLI
jgi:CBS domain containing-hemolysin-like protein